jgi:hypothetical protein
MSKVTPFSFPIVPPTPLARPAAANAAAVQQTTPLPGSTRGEMGTKLMPQAPMQERATESVKKDTFLSKNVKTPSRFRTWRSRVDAEKKFKFIDSGQEKNEVKTQMKMCILKEKMDKGHLDFGRLQELKNSGSINESEFTAAAIHLFKDQATEEKGLMDILCEKCGIEQGGDLYNEVFGGCLINPDLADTPLLAAEISEKDRNTIDAQKNPCTNPPPELCKAVMAASTVEEMAELFDQFATKFSSVSNNQKNFYKNANQFKSDLHRGFAELDIGGQKVRLSIKTLGDGKSLQQMSTEEFFQKILNHLKQPTEEGGAGLEDAQAMQVMKQFLLAYCAQNGTGDGASVFLMAMNEKTSCNISPQFHGAEAYMVFQKREGDFVLTEKMEDSPIIGMRNEKKDGESISSEVRFKFPEETEVRTQLPVRSVRKQTEDVTIQWECDFRENPPRKVILYGGCKPSAS